LKLVPQINQQAVLRWLIAVGFGVVGTIQYHAAQFTSRFDSFFGDRGDARGFIYFCEHWYQALCGKTNLMSPAIFYPTTGTLAYSDLLFGFAIPYSIVRALGANMFSAVEVVVVALTLATYVATFLLLNRVLRFALVPSIVGAMFFAFSSPKFFQTGHIQLQFILGLPLIFILLILFYQRAAHLSQGKAALYLSVAGLCLLLQLTTTFYYAWYFVLWSFLFFIVALILPASRKSLFALLRKFWLAMTASAAVFLAGFLPFILIYARTIRVGEWVLVQKRVRDDPAMVVAFVDGRRQLHLGVAGRAGEAGTMAGDLGRADDRHRTRAFDDRVVVACLRCLHHKVSVL
jgi:hypothetical protein